MMSHTLEELKEAVARDYDAVLVVEALDISVEDLLDAFEDRFMRQQDKFIDALEDVQDDVDRMFYELDPEGTGFFHG